MGRQRVHYPPVPIENRKPKTENPGPPPALYRNLSFTLMWTSTAASGFGDRMIMLVALALLGGMVAGVDATATQASTQFWFFLPYLIFSMVGGWLADLMPRKWLLMACDELRGLILLGAAAMAWSMTGSAQLPPDAVWFSFAGVEVLQTWRVYTTLLAIGIFAATFNPTRNAIIPQIIPTPQLTVANAVILVINVVASQIGLLLGERIISQDDAGTVRTGLLLGAAFYLVSGVFFAFLKPLQTIRPRAARMRPRALLAAATYTRRHRQVAILVGLNVLIWPAAAIVTSAFFGLGKMHYGLTGDPLLAHFAYLSVTLGVGMLLGAALVSLLSVRRESPIIYLTAIAGAGLGVLILAAVPLRPVAFAACLMIGLCGNVAIVAILTIIQSITPNFMRGRVMGLNTLLNTTLSVLTYFAIWRLPNADANIASVMYVLGPLLMGVGVFGLARYLPRGPLARRDANAFWHLNRLFCFVFHRVRFIGKHRVPRDGAVVLASNHTSALDPFVLQAGLNRKARWLMLTAYLLWPARPLWRAIEPIALDRESSDSVKLRSVAQELRHGELVGIFPEGGLQRSVRQLQPFQPGAAVMARLGKAVIVPAWVAGTPVADSMLRHMLQPSRTVVVFGRPWTPDKHAEPEAVMAELRKRILALRDEVGNV